MSSLRSSILFECLAIFLPAFGVFLPTNKADEKHVELQKLSLAILLQYSKPQGNWLVTETSRQWGRNLFQSGRAQVHVKKLLNFFH